MYEHIRDFQDMIGDLTGGEVLSCQHLRFKKTDDDWEVALFGNGQLKVIRTRQYDGSRNNWTKAYYKLLEFNIPNTPFEHHIVVPSSSIIRHFVIDPVEGVMSKPYMIGQHYPMDRHFQRCAFLMRYLLSMHGSEGVTPKIVKEALLGDTVYTAPIVVDNIFFARYPFMALALKALVSMWFCTVDSVSPTQTFIRLSWGAPHIMNEISDKDFYQKLWQTESGIAPVDTDELRMRTNFGEVLLRPIFHKLGELN